MLGRAMCEALSGSFEIHPRNLEEPDVTDSSTISEAISKVRPSYVIHLAAMTDVDACELDPSRAYEINAEGTRNVAMAARSCDAVMVYLGTGMIYDGLKETPYIETDPPNPVNVYGRSKLKGELTVEEINERRYIFTSCWLFGGGKEDKKFVAKILDRARRSKEICVVKDTFGSPTYTKDLAAAIRDNIGKIPYGKYHCVNVGVTSRLEMAEEILISSGIKGCRIVPVESSAFPLPAARPRMEALLNWRFEQLGIFPMRSWREALREYLRTVFG